MPDVGSSRIVVLHAPLGNLSSILQLFPSLIFTSRRHSPRGDDNLDEAEYFLQVTQSQLDAIHTASQQASETYAEEIQHIENDLDKMNSWLNTVKKARESRSTLKQTLQRLGNDAATKDVLQAARKLSKKAKHTSARVASESRNSSTTASITLETAPSSEYSVVPRSQLTEQDNLSGIAFPGHPTADAGKKIQGLLRLVDSEPYPDDEESGSVRALRSRRSDLSTFSYHNRGPDTCNAEESRPKSSDTSSQLSSPPRSSTGMQLGPHTTFNQCHINFLSMQSSDNSKISEATANLGVGSVGRSHVDTSPSPSTCPSCCGSQGAEAIQTTDMSPQDVAVEDIQSAPEQHSPVASSSQAQDSNPAVTTQPPSEADPGEGGNQQASPLKASTEYVTSHSLTVSGSATVFSPTMNFNSTGCIGATNMYRGGRAPGDCPPPQTSAESQERSGFKSMQFSGNSVSYNATFNEESHNSAGVYNEEVAIPAS